MAGNVGIPPLAMTKQRLSQRCGMSLSTIDRAIASGDLKAFKVGSRTLIMEADAAVWLTAKPVKGDAA